MCIRNSTLQHSLKTAEWPLDQITSNLPDIDVMDQINWAWRSAFQWPFLIPFSPTHLSLQVFFSLCDLSLWQTGHIPYHNKAHAFISVFFWTFTVSAIGQSGKMEWSFASRICLALISPNTRYTHFDKHEQLRNESSDLKLFVLSWIFLKFSMNSSRHSTLTPCPTAAILWTNTFVA